jgi:diphthine synthase
VNERFKSFNIECCFWGRLLSELIFVGLGLNDENGISLSGLEEAKSADRVFIELYTNLLPNFSLKNLQKLVGKQIQVLSRQNLEEENGEMILDEAQNGKVVFLIPGDPFIATTHVTLRIEASKRKVATRVVHGASIISAIVGFSGLHNYKFGKTVTIPFRENIGETPYNVIAQNHQLGLHTLCLLDLKAEEERFLTIHEALILLKEIEGKKRIGVVTDGSLAVGLARAGSKTPTLKADFVDALLDFDFGAPPMSMIFPGKLHFMEAEALIAFAGAPVSLRSMII